MLKRSLTFVGLFGVFLLLTPIVTFAQNVWSLQKCIDHALENNLSIKQQQLSARSSKASLVQSKAQVLPSLSGNASHDYNFGRIFDIGSGAFTQKQTLTQNFNLGSSVTLFSGLQNYNTILQSNYDYLAEEQNLKRSKNDLALNVAMAYLQVLFNSELVQIAMGQTKLSKEQVDRIEKLVNVGSSAKGDLLDMQAQLANEELNQITAENNLSISYLNLMQLLNLEADSSFRIAKPDFSEPQAGILNSSAKTIYEKAVQDLPEIQSAELLLLSSEKGLSASRGAISPRLSLTGSYGSRYSQLNRMIDPANPFGDLIIIPYWDQIDQNTYKSVGLSLSVPLFTRLQTRTSIEQSKINVLSNKYALDQAKNTLRQQIEQAFADATAAFKKFEAGKKALNASKEAFGYAKIKFEVGTISAFDFNNSKNNLQRAESDLLQSRYDYIFKMKILDFYSGKQLSFN